MERLNESDSTTPFSRLKLASRSTELLMNLEDGLGLEMPGTFEVEPLSPIQLTRSEDQFVEPVGGGVYPDPPTPALLPLDLAFPEAETSMVEIDLASPLAQPKPVSKSSWRQWGNDEGLASLNAVSFPPTYPLAPGLESDPGLEDWEDVLFEHHTSSSPSVREYDNPFDDPEPVIDLERGWDEEEVFEAEVQPEEMVGPQSSEIGKDEEPVVRPLLRTSPSLDCRGLGPISSHMPTPPASPPLPLQHEPLSLAVAETFEEPSHVIGVEVSATIGVQDAGAEEGQEEEEEEEEEEEVQKEEKEEVDGKADGKAVQQVEEQAEERVEEEVEKEMEKVACNRTELTEMAPAFEGAKEQCIEESQNEENKEEVEGGRTEADNIEETAEEADLELGEDVEVPSQTDIQSYDPMEEDPPLPEFESSAFVQAEGLSPTEEPVAELEDVVTSPEFEDPPSPILPPSPLADLIEENYPVSEPESPDTETTPSPTSTSSSTADSETIEPKAAPQPSSSSISVASTIFALHRMPDPLNMVLSMVQVRPGLGVGADPAWMVRFMMAVYGWVLMSVGGMN